MLSNLCGGPYERCPPSKRVTTLRKVTALHSIALFSESAVSLSCGAQLGVWSIIRKMSALFQCKIN